MFGVYELLRVSYLWYPGLKRPAWEGPGSESDIVKGRFLANATGM